MPIFVKYIKMMARKIPFISHLVSIRDNVAQIAGILPPIRDFSYTVIDDYLNQYMRENTKYQDPKRLNKFEYQVYSQGGEDGIIAEIFKRIGVTNKVFVEFGVGNGLQNNTNHLLVNGWRGFWLDGSAKYIQKIEKTHSFLLQRKQLVLKHSFVTVDNVEMLFQGIGIPREFDLLSIDIDRNDYWIWKAIQHYRPRVAVIEYNALFRPGTQWVIPYHPEGVWDKTCQFGASLTSLELLGRSKGYKLVGCSFTGVNAFFVREDLVSDYFLEPFTAENHYEPPRYFLARRIVGHKRNFGDFLNI